MKALIKFLKENRGTTSIEMGLICALIVLAMLSTLNLFADESMGIWNKVSTRTADAMSKSTN